MAGNTRVTSFKFASIYVDNLDACQKFYETYLGFQKTAEFSPGEIFGNLGAVEMWMGEGYERIDAGERAARATLVLGVDSVGSLFEALQAGNVKTVQDSPVEMQVGVFWLQFFDPAGNIIEVLGGI
jgi:catechol 2,3-dioxygenase-like lactoylglutathione lyase family enzyme